VRKSAALLHHDIGDLDAAADMCASAVRAGYAASFAACLCARNSCGATAIAIILSLTA
jgi:hypothetical protein